MASHKLRELNKYIRALDTMTEATKSFRSCDQLLDSGQDMEVLKLEIQIQTVKHYLLRDEKDVYPTLTYIRNDEKTTLDSNQQVDVFAMREDQPPPPNTTPPSEVDFQPPPPPGSPPQFQRKFSRLDLALEESDSDSHAQSLPSSFDDRKYNFADLAEKFGHVEPENVPSLISSQSKSEPQSPRHRKSASSKMRRSGSGRHKWDFFTADAITKGLRRSKNTEDDEDRDQEKSRSWPKNGRSRSNRGSNRSSKEKAQTPWEIVNTLNQNHQDLIRLVRAQEDSLSQINQILNSN